MLIRMGFQALAAAVGVSIAMTVLFAQNTALGAKQRAVENGYFVISNFVDRDNRVLRILLNQEFFTEQCLRELLSEFSAKYPEPERLDIYLYSSLEQTRGFVNGRPHHGSYLLIEKDDPDFWRRYAHAILFRQAGNEVIRYYLPGGKDANLKQS